MNDHQYVEVIVDNNSTNTDMTYTYQIPDKYLSAVEIGKRILVPFGFGNKKVEALIINLTNKSNFDKNKIKYINKIIDDEPIISKELIELGKWMRNKYLSTYNDVYKTIIPTGISNKVNKYIKLINGNINLSDINSKYEKMVVEILLENNQIEINKLKETLNINNLSGTIKALTKKRIVKVYEKIDVAIGKKFEKFVKINSEIKIDNIIETLDKRAHKQILILNYLKLNNELTIKEVLQKTNTNLSSIKSLEAKGYIVTYNKEVKRDAITKNIKKYNKFKLTKDQQICFDEISMDIKCNRKNKFLIHGVTGSGKTEIYLQLIENMIKLDKQSIVLVPEISLTPQTVDRFVGRFGDRVAIFHSRLSLGERYDEWRKIKEGSVDIVVGARSAIFAPFNNLGLIIIDEEHETSYKSNMNPKYNALEVAEKRCELENGFLILGSATPSVNTFYRSIKKEIKLISLNNRVNNKDMPEVEIVDMKNELINGNKSIFSKILYESIGNNLKQKKQTMIFINRRGFSSFVSCRKCGFVMKCKNCDISLTYHRKNELLRCHYCGLASKLPVTCPECDSKYIKHFGIGTQKVEDYIKKEFPFARVARMDVDTTSRKGSHERILERVKNKEVDILIGTQMITKGLDFPNVTLVGIIAADMALNLPDYNSSERTFQLITQVSGRAGRGEHEGKVVLQTYDPNHYSLRYAKSHDYINFFKNEIVLRKEFNYPPYSTIINIIGSSENEEEIIKDIQEIYKNIINDIKEKIVDFNNDNTLGPNAAPISRINGKFRYQILIKCDNDNIDVIKGIIYKHCILNYEKNNLVRFSIDINPNSIM